MQNLNPHFNEIIIEKSRLFAVTMTKPDGAALGLPKRERKVNGRYLQVCPNKLTLLKFDPQLFSNALIGFVDEHGSIIQGVKILFYVKVKGGWRVTKVVEFSDADEKLQFAAEDAFVDWIDDQLTRNDGTMGDPRDYYAM